MTFFGVDDGLAFHRKAVQAGNPALGLWVRAGSWCARYLTDGFVPKDIAKSLGSPAQIKALVTARLWEETQGGYRFHEWEQTNPTRREVDQLRSDRAVAGRKGGQAKARARRAADAEAAGQGDLFASNDVASAKQTPSTSQASALAKPGTGIPDPLQTKETSSLSPNADASGAARRAAAVSADDDPDGLDDPAEAEPRDDDPPVTAQTVVGVWVDANRENGVTPSGPQCSQVGKLARELLASNDAGRVVSAARQAGRKGYASIDRELTSMNGRHIPAGMNGSAVIRPSHTDARVAAGLSLVEELAAEDAARKAALTPKEIEN